MSSILLTTKLFPPPAHEGLVARPRLVERLVTGLRQGRKLALVSAPAGFGKTTLVVEAARQMGVTPAWVTLDGAENDPVRFWRYVVAALRRVQPAVGSLAQAMLEANQPPPLEAVVTALLNDLADCAEPVLLVLDDYHEMDTAAIHESISFFLDHLPPSLCCAITTRADPPLALARRRGRMQMVEIRAADLRFTPEEAAVLLNQTMRLGLAERDLDLLLRRTEGWAAGLQMAALAMQGLAEQAASGDAMHSFVTSFAGDDHYIGDYLVEEVLQHQPQHVQAFLFQTSLLDRLCAPLCDALLETTGSQALLQRLEHANLFLIPLDTRQEWYRYHRLFAELLRGRLRQLYSAEAVGALHRRASQWFAAREYWTEAVDHALLAGDPALAVDLLSQASTTMFLRSEIPAYRALVLRLPEEMRWVSPGVCLQWAWAALSTNHPEEALRAIQAVEHALGVSADLVVEDTQAVKAMPDPFRTLVVSLAMILTSLGAARMDVQATIRRCEAVLDVLQAQPIADFRCVAMFNLGLSREALGEAEPASAALREAVVEARQTANVHILPLALSHLGQIQVIQGRLKEAAAAFREGVQVQIADGSRPSPFASVAYAGLGGVLYEQNDLPGARAAYARSLELGRPWNNWESFFPASVGLAQVMAAEGDRQGAADFLEEADRFWQQEAKSGPLGHFHTWQALLLEDPARIEAVLRRDAFDLGPENIRPLFAQETVALLHARLWSLLGRPERVEEAVQGVIHPAEQKERWGVLVQALALASLAAAQQNHSPQALAFLRRALALAEPGGFTRTFLDLGAPMANLLAELAKEGTPSARRLLLAFPEAVLGAASPPPAPVRSAGLPEPLTERELDVLRLLATGLSNSEIAARLVITAGTVKAHTNNLYAKLGVNNRTAAVARARLFGLV